MAAGKWNMQKASGGVASITVADGVGATNIVLPESGTIATTSNIVGFKNYIINGGFDIWQRGTSFTNTTTQGTNLDGNFIASQTPSGTCVLVKDIISYNDTAYNALKATANSINVSSSSFFVFYWTLEGLNTYHLQNKELTLSFLIEVSHSGNYNLNIRKYNSSNAIHKTFAKLIPLVAGVNNVVVNIPADSGEIQNSNNRGLSFVIAGDSNSNSTSVEGWQSGNFATINGARRWWETNGAYVKVAQVQLEEGSIATPFENLSYALQYEQCRRYYRRYATQQNVNDLAYKMRTTPTESGTAPYTYGAEM